MVDLLRARTGLELGPGTITLCGQTLPCRITQEPRDRDFPLPALPPASARHRFGQPRPAAVAAATPWRRRPSSLIATANQPLPRLSHFSLDAPIGARPDGFAAATERGSAWHLAFRCLFERPDLRPRLAVATGIDPATLDRIAAQVGALRGWLAAQGYDRLLFELALQERAPDGSKVNAILDCLAEGPAGLLILDHKSGPCPDPAQRFPGYLPQLAAYAGMVRRRWPDKPLRGIAINWMNEGLITLSPIQRTGIVRIAFNLPFRPFVLASTSVGQEGLDFHPWCHRLVHWNLPPNPVDMEQREGRIHRYKNHAVRLNLAERFADRLHEGAAAAPWAAMFAAAHAVASRPGDLEPFWLLEGPHRIKRHVLSPPFSSEESRLSRLKRPVAIYRLAFGQPRQDDLLAFLEGVADRLSPAELSRLQIDLRPIRE